MPTYQMSVLHSSGAWHMRNLRLGSHGAPVSAVQKLLAHQGTKLSADGFFGPRTDRAVRVFQRSKNLYPPDGIVGAETLTALQGKSAISAQPAATADKHFARSSLKPASLSLAPPLPANVSTFSAFSIVQTSPGPLSGMISDARAWAKYFPQLFNLPQPPAVLQTSPAGLLFIAAEEEQPGVSNHLHFPGGNSGVTLGPGYDMKGKSVEQIELALALIGIDKPTATAVAAASGKSGADAKAFVDRNKKLINLTNAQQAGLLTHTIGRYEAMVRKVVTKSLYDYEFDALVSFAYNPGGGWYSTTGAVNQARYHDAMTFVSHQVHSGNVILPGLVSRRQKEISLFVYGKYK